MQPFPYSSLFHKIVRAVPTVLAFCFGPALLAQSQLHFSGPVALSRPANEVAKPIARERECELRFETQSGNAGAVFQLAKRQATIALLTREVRPDERAEYPNLEFTSRRVGVEAVVPVVERSVWDAGVKSLTKAQLLSIYDREIRNWKQIGGPDVPVTFINLEQDNPAREALLLWFYEDPARIPVRPFKVAIDGLDASLSEEFGKGYLTYSGFRETYPHHVRPLALRLEDGSVIEPTVQEIVTGRWPIQRPLVAVAVRPITGVVREFIERLSGPEGLAAFGKFSLVHEKQLATPKRP
jgi:phosphate transport system substrate-binding protein